MPPPSTNAAIMTPTTPPTPAATATACASVLAAATRATPEIKTQDLQAAADYYQKATELAHGATSIDDYVRAIELFSIAIAVRSDQPRFFFARGNAFRAINELEFAAKDYTLAIALDDRTAAYYANRGACYRKLNKPVKALEDLTAAVDMDSKKANHYFNRAQVLYDRSFYKEAIIDLTKTLEEGSAGIRVEYKALQLRGNCHRKLANIQKCIDDLQRAIQLDGRNSSGFSLLAQAYLDAGDLDNAVEHFSNAIQFNNSQASYFALRGLCYYRKCNGGSASVHASGAASFESAQNARMCLADFNQSIKLDGKDPQAYFYRGSIRLALALDLIQATVHASSAGGTATATKPVALAVASPVSSAEAVGGDADSGLSRLTSSIAASLTGEEQLEASFADIEMAWTLSPKGAKFQIGMAMITQLKQQYVAASALFRDINTSDRANAIVKYHWALCCHMLREVEPCLTLLCDCVEAIPNEPLFFEARALVLQEAGHHEMAIGDWTEAIAIRQELSDHVGNEAIRWNFYLRSESHLRLNQYEDAISDATQALAAHVPLAPTAPAPGPDTPSAPVAAVVLPQLLETSAHNARAMAHRGLGQYDQALDDLTACLRLTPDNEVFLYHRALCFLECERFAEALPDFVAALAMAPEDAYIMYCVGLCYYHEKKPLQCIEYLEGARTRIEARRDAQGAASRAVLPDLHYRLGVAHALEGRTIKAIEHFTFAIDYASQDESPSAAEAVLRYVHERAKALQLERYFDESIEDFSFVILHNPHNAHAYFRRGFAYKSLGQLKEAAADFESAKLLDPKNPRLVVKYKELKDTECVVLCAPGQEPAF